LEQVRSVVVRELAAFLGNDDADACGSVATSVAALIELLLSDHEQWTRFRWIDGLAVDRVDRSGPLGVEIRGVIQWVDGRNWFIDPCFVVVELTQARDGLARFEASVGDAATGLGTVPFERKGPRSWEHLSEWAIVLTG
jgi:hypothetical protein